MATKGGSTEPKSAEEHANDRETAKSKKRRKAGRFSTGNLVRDIEQDKRNAVFDTALECLDIFPGLDIEDVKALLDAYCNIWDISLIEQVERRFDEEHLLHLRMAFAWARLQPDHYGTRIAAFKMDWFQEAKQLAHKMGRLRFEKQKAAALEAAKRREAEKKEAALRPVCDRATELAEAWASTRAETDPTGQSWPKYEQAVIEDGNALIEHYLFGNEEEVTELEARLSEDFTSHIRKFVTVAVLEARLIIPALPRNNQWYSETVTSQARQFIRDERRRQRAAQAAKPQLATVS